MNKVLILLLLYITNIFGSDNNALQDEYKAYIEEEIKIRNNHFHSDRMFSLQNNRFEESENYLDNTGLPSDIQDIIGDYCSNDLFYELDGQTYFYKEQELDCKHDYSRYEQISFCLLPNNRIVYYDAFGIYIFDIDKNKVIKAIYLESFGIYNKDIKINSLDFFDNKITVVLNNKLIMILDVNLKQLLVELVCNSFPTTLCKLDNDRLAIGLKNGNIEIWDIKLERLIRTLIGDFGNAITFLSLLEDGTLASRSDKKNIKIWNIDSGECIRILDGIQSDNLDKIEIVLSNDQMDKFNSYFQKKYNGFLLGKPKIYDLKNGKFLVSDPEKFSILSLITSGFKYKLNILYSLGYLLKTNKPFVNNQNLSCSIS